MSAPLPEAKSGQRLGGVLALVEGVLHSIVAGIRGASDGRSQDQFFLKFFWISFFIFST